MGKKSRIKIKEVPLILWRTCTDFSVYAHLRKFNVLEILKYLIVFAFCFSLFLGGIAWHENSKIFKGIFDNIQKDFPVLTLQNGTLTSSEDRSIVVSDESSSFSVLIETGKNSSEKDSIETESLASVVFFEDAVWYKFPNSSEDVSAYPLLEEPMVFDNERIEGFKKYFGIFSFIGFSLIFFFVHLGSFLFYGLFFGTILYLMLKVTVLPLTYKETLNVALLVTGPALFYSTIIRLMGIGSELMFLFIYIFFLLGTLATARRGEALQNVR